MSEDCLQLNDGTPAKDVAGLEKTARALYGEYSDEFLKVREFDKNDFERSMGSLQG